MGMAYIPLKRLSRYCSDVRKDFMRTVRRGGFRVFNPAIEAAEERARIRAIKKAAKEIAEIIERRKVR